MYLIFPALGGGTLAVFPTIKVLKPQSSPPKLGLGGHAWATLRVIAQQSLMRSGRGRWPYVELNRIYLLHVVPFA